MRDPALLGFAALIGIPLLAAFAARRLRGRASDAAALAGAAGAAAVAVWLVAVHGLGGIAVRIGGLAALDRAMGRPVPLFGVALDPLSSLVLLAAVLIGFACALFSVPYVGPGNREAPHGDDRRTYWFWLLGFVAAMAGLVTSATPLQMFVFWEITTVCSWALIGFYEEEPGALSAARKAFLMTAGGGLALFVSLVIAIALTGSAGFDALSRLPAGSRGAAGALLLLALAGAWAKSGQVPFHTWLPSAMVAPSPVSAYLHAASMVNAGVYLVLRLALSNVPAAFPVAAAVPGAAAPAAMAAPAQGIAPAIGMWFTPLPGWLPWAIGAMAVVTLAVAVAQFFYQDDLKRLLALSTIAHLALVLLGAALAFAGSARAAQGAALHVLAHGAGKALLFLSVGTLAYAAGTRRVSALAGVRPAAPLAAGGFLIGTLTVAGVPPFAGFWSKLMLLQGAVELGGPGTFAAALVVAESVVAFAWLLWVGQRVFLGPPSAAAAAMARTPAAMGGALVLLMVLCLAAALFGVPLALAVRPGGFGG
jgi:hydrogenase-4 component D